MNTYDFKHEIEVLDLSSFLLSPNEKKYIFKVQELGIILKNESLKSFSLSQSEIESEFIRIFNLNASALKTIPFASWWIDGSMMGESYIQIVEFYKECGYVIDSNKVKLPSDHISLMLFFLSILLENKKYKKSKEFIKNYFFWLSSLNNSLEKSTKVEFFPILIKNIMDLLKNIVKKINDMEDLQCKLK